MNTPRRCFIYTLVLAFSLSGCSDLADPVAVDVDPEFARGAQEVVGVIVALDPDFAPGGHAANQARARAIARSLGAEPSQAYGTALFGFAAAVPEGRLAALDRDPRIAHWERDQVASIPQPGASAPRWCPDNPNHKACSGEEEEEPSPGGQETPDGIARVGGAVASNGTAWVIDTGIDLDHPDLNVDVGRSANFVAKGKKSADDGNGHGTHVAGTIAAIDNSIGVVGVAEGAYVVSVRVLDNSGSGTYSAVIAGVDYVADNGAGGDVANMSLTGPPSQALDAAVQAAAAGGVKFALAAGNSGADAVNYSPARANGPNIWTVSAIGSNDYFASFSNWGNPPVDVAAPGVGILSTWKGGGLNTISGTSMATPHVAGLLLSGWNGTSYDGTAYADPDGDADKIAHRTGN